MPHGSPESFMSMSWAHHGLQVRASLLFICWMWLQIVPTPKEPIVLHIFTQYFAKKSKNAKKPWNFSKTQEIRGLAVSIFCRSISNQNNLWPEKWGKNHDSGLFSHSFLFFQHFSFFFPLSSFSTSHNFPFFLQFLIFLQVFLNSAFSFLPKIFWNKKNVNENLLYFQCIPPVKGRPLHLMEMYSNNLRRNTNSPGDKRPSSDCILCKKPEHHFTDTCMLCFLNSGGFDKCN